MKVCFNKLLYKQILIGERKVCLMRHIPLLGIFGYYQWSVIRNYLPAPSYCENIKNSDVLLIVPSGKCSVLAFLDSKGRYVQRYYDSTNHPEKTGVAFFVLNLLFYWYINMTPPYRINSHRTMLSFGTTIAFFWLTERILQTRSVLTRQEYIPTKGTVILNANTPDFQQEVEGLSRVCRDGESRYAILGNNCSTQAARLLNSAVSPEMKQHLGQPLLFWTPVDMLIRAHNINALSALEPDVFKRTVQEQIASEK